MKCYLCSCIVVFALCGASHAQNAMVVEVQGELVTVSRGADSGVQVGDRFTVLRSSSSVGEAQVQEVSEYQCQARLTPGSRARVGDRALSPEQARAQGRKLSKGIEFETRASSGPAVDQGDLADLYGIYNLVENQRYAARYGDFYGDSSVGAFANAQLAYGLANIVLGQVQRASYRQPRVRPAKVRFELTVWESDLQSQHGLEVLVRIRNIGWQELRFEQLDRHLFLMDSDGYPVAIEDSEMALDATLKPGESTQGLVWFPPATLGSRPKFAFEDMLGERGQLSFR